MLHEIRDWLKTDHGCQTSITSLSDWAIRHRDDGARIVNELDPLKLAVNGCEITVTPCAAHGLRVTVRPVETK